MFISEIACVVKGDAVVYLSARCMYMVGQNNIYVKYIYYYYIFIVVLCASFAFLSKFLNFFYKKVLLFSTKSPHTEL